MDRFDFRWAFKCANCKSIRFAFFKATSGISHGLEKALLNNDSNCCNSPDYHIIGDYPEQCTGLKDKNGKLIFEGDKIKFNHVIQHTDIVAEKTGVVRYNESYCCFFMMWDGFNANYSKLGEVFNIEIIGTIHDNEVE